MPTVLKSGPYRFYFYSHEPNEPPHVHVDRDELSAKFWLDPAGLVRNFGFTAHEVNTIQSLVETTGKSCWRLGMGILAVAADERVADVSFDQDALSVRLKDGRTISVPLAWYPRLFHATAEQRRNWKIAGGGYGIHWPEIDEDISTEGLLRGAPAPRSIQAK